MHECQTFLRLRYWVNFWCHVQQISNAAYYWLLNLYHLSAAKFYTQQLISTIVFHHVSTLKHVNVHSTTIYCRDNQSIALKMTPLSHCHNSLPSLTIHEELWTQKATYRLSESEPSSHSAGREGKGENMWWLINNTPNFTSATFKDQTCRHKSMAASC